MAEPLDLVFSALADPTRRQILVMLLEDDCTVTDLAEPFEMSLAAISKHIAILARAGLISQEKRGRIKWCGLKADALKDASVWMESFGQFEAINLDAFERFLAAEIQAAEIEHVEIEHVEIEDAAVEDVAVDPTIADAAPPDTTPREDDHSTG